MDTVERVYKWKDGLLRVTLSDHGGIEAAALTDVAGKETAHWQFVRSCPYPMCSHIAAAVTGCRAAIDRHIAKQAQKAGGA